LNTYGVTKLAGEQFIQAYADRFFVIRTSALYGASPCRAKAGLNFVQLMLKLARERGEVSVVTDEVVSPTYAADLAQQIVELTGTDSYGTFHVTNQGACSWYEFAAEIFEQTGTPVKVRAARSSDFPKKSPRPTYSVLENRALQQLGMDRMPDWRESLRRYLEAVSGATV
jgi:dTDP-4-dehydrorhamnose reductase